MNSSPRTHILLTVLGVGLKPTTYVWDERCEASKVAPAALYALLPEADRPDRVLAFCTPEAKRDSLPELKRYLRAGCPIEVVEISFDRNDEAIHKFLATLAEQVPAGADLTVDVTHGPRHLSFLTYAGVLYLVALRGVRLRAAYYGVFGGDEEPSQFFDLRPLVELPMWSHALRVFADTGSAHAMADLVKASDKDRAGQVGDALRGLSEAYVSGLPIESGYLARRFLAEQVEPLRKLLGEQRLPLADELVSDLAKVLSRQRLAQELPDRSWKAHVRLDRVELARQARIIDDFLGREDYPTAFGLMREWLVLWAMWRTRKEDGWLSYRARRRAEGLLHSLTERQHESSRTLAAIGQTWRLLRELRNRYAHHGLGKDVTLSTEADLMRDVTAVVRVWKENLRTVPELPLSISQPSAGRILISPMGLRPGVLFSALLKADPNQLSRCLVICSTETEGAIRQACQKAGYSGDVVALRFDDPFAGVRELKRLVREAQRHLSDAGEVFVNVTGGTTVMGVLAERIAGKARHDRPVYRFALIDRRPPAVQEADPYQAGEMCWLDDPPEA